MQSPKARCEAAFPASLPCRMAFVGEAPGEVEMRVGTPLSGPSGRVFNQLLRSANLDRGEFLVTNVFDVQAPENNIHAWTVPVGEARERGWTDTPWGAFEGRWFDPALIAPALERLRAELLRAGPTVVVPLGNLALWALTGLSSVTQSRGAVAFANRLVPGIKIVPTFHPAFVIRTWKMFHVVVSDLIKADGEALLGSGTNYSEREIWIEPRLGDLEIFRKKFITGCDLLSVDIETTAKWRQITCIGFAPSAGRALVVPLVDWRKPNRSYWRTVDEELQVMNWIGDVLASPIPKLFQNGPYDVYWLWDVWGMPVMNYREDTRLLHHALYPELPKDLGFMGASYAQQGPWKIMRGDKSEKKDD